MNLDDLLKLLIIETEKEIYEQEITDFTRNISDFAKSGNIKQTDFYYKSLRERIKKHKQLLSKLRNMDKDESDSKDS